MKTSGIGRVLATLLIGALFGAYRHYGQMRWLGRGRDAFLAQQGQTYDRFAAYHSSATMLIAGIIVVAIAVGLYELIAAGFTRLVPPSEMEE